MRKKSCFLIFLFIIIGFPVLFSGCKSSGTSKLLVLRYDRFYGNKPIGVEGISKKKFERDIKYLKATGYNSISLKELNVFLGKKGNLPSKPLLITFDNGWESQYSIAFPILKKYNFRAVLFPFSGQIGMSEKLTWKKLKRMLDSKNFEIGTKGDILYQKTKAPIEDTGGVSLNFDDGWQSVYDNAFPILKEKNMIATVFPIINGVKRKDVQYMNISRLKELQEAGWEIGSHTLSHPNLKTLKNEVLVKELKDSKEFLLSNGFRVENVALPFGGYDNRVLKEGLRYYSNIRTSRNPMNLSSAERLIDGLSLEKDIDIETIKKWIEQVKNQKSWLVMIFHQIDDSGRDYAITPNMFREIIEEITKNGVPVYTLATAKSRPLIFQQQNGLVVESDQIYQERITSDFAKAKKIFQNKLGKDPQFLAYPYGVSYKVIQKSAQKAGYKGAFTSIAGFNKKPFHPFEIKRIQVTENLILGDILE